MLRIAVNVDDKREFYLLTSNPDARTLPIGIEFKIEEVNGEIAERLRAHHPQAWRQDPALKIVNLTGEINDDWIRNIPGRSSDLGLVY